MKDKPTNGISPPNQGRRNQFEIWAEVLEACTRKGRTQSALLRQLRLKTSAIKDAIDFLIGAGLVQESGDDNRLYLTTPKGEEALITYYRLITNYFKKK